MPLEPPVLISESTAEQVADAMFALSSPTRVQILGCLLAGPSPVGEIVETLGFEQSAVSHQLRVLRDLALVKVERVGRKRVYALYDDRIAALLQAALEHVERRDRGRSPAREGAAG